MFVSFIEEIFRRGQIPCEVEFLRKRDEDFIDKYFLDELWFELLLFLCIVEGNSVLR